MEEEAKVAIRSIRRDSMDKLKALKKNGEITEDDLKDAEKKMQNQTDKFIKEIESISQVKEKEIMEKEFQTGTSYVPSFRTGSTDVNTIQHRYFQEPKQECTVCSTSGAYYLSAIACFCLTFIYPPAVIGAVICVCRAKKARKGGRK